MRVAFASTLYVVLILGYFCSVDSQLFNSESLRRTALATSGMPVFPCSSSETHFELMTGQVLTAPDDVLDSRPGTLMLTDCIDLCRRNVSCKAANFETGLCVLFSTSAEERPGGLTPSQYPVFTLYAQKVCLKSAPSCQRAWTFERVEGFTMDKYAKKAGKVESREMCQTLCLTEKDFQCRSAMFKEATGDCRISDMDRHTIARTNDFVVADGDLYMENNCVDDPVKLCDFELLPNRIMKTVDSVYQDVPTMEACRDLCLTAPYRCHSFDYGDTGDRVCRLSHHTAASLSGITEPFLVIEEVVGTYELSACYNVTIECRAADMVAKVRTNQMFDGKIYAKENPNSCVVDVSAAIEFSIAMAYNDLECDVMRKEQGVYSKEVIIQHHDSIVTSADLGLALNCQYDLANRTIVNDFDLAIRGEIEPSLVEQAVVRSPNVVMKVTQRGGEAVDSAQVGDPLELHFEIIDDRTPYEIFVRDLVAKDGNDQNQITLLDSEGCPTEGRILRPLQKAKESSMFALTAEFDAFKFPTSQVVQFRAHVTPCMPTCEPAKCSVDADYGNDIETVDSYGRKKRSVDDNELLVTQAFLVRDKFAGKRSRNHNNSSSVEIAVNTTNVKSNVKKTSKASHWSKSSSPSSSVLFDESVSTLAVAHDEICLNALGLTASLVLFLIFQVALVLVFGHLRRKRGKKIEENGNIHVFNPYAR